MWWCHSARSVLGVLSKETRCVQLSNSQEVRSDGLCDGLVAVYCIQLSEHFGHVEIDSSRLDAELERDVGARLASSR